jgi:acetyl-CoA hydrolase
LSGLQKCAHPDYKDQLLDYLEHAERQCAKTKSLHEPHMLAMAFKMYQNLREKGSMKVDNWVS